MKRHLVLLVCLGVLCFTLSAQAQETKKGEKKTEGLTDASALCADTEPSLKVVSTSKYVPVVKYDPARNAAQDIQDAVSEANRTNKRVLVEVGGLWCIWCHHMDDFFDTHPDILTFREKTFVMVKVNYSDENKNEAVLSQYPKVAGYPHIFILSADGKLLRSQDTGELEEGKSYNVDKFMEFLKEWATAPVEAMPSQATGK